MDNDWAYGKNSVLISIFVKRGSTCRQSLVSQLGKTSNETQNCRFLGFNGLTWEYLILFRSLDRVSMKDSTGISWSFTIVQ